MDFLFGVSSSDIVKTHFPGAHDVSDRYFHTYVLIKKSIFGILLDQTPKNKFIVYLCNICWGALWTCFFGFHPAKWR